MHYLVIYSEFFSIGSHRNSVVERKSYHFDVKPTKKQWVEILNKDQISMNVVHFMLESKHPFKDVE